MDNDDQNGGAGAGGAGTGGAGDLLGGAGAAAGGAGDQQQGAGDQGAGDQGNAGGDGQQQGADGQGAVDPDWYQHIPAEAGEGDEPSLRDWLKSAGIKDIAGLAKVARDNQKAVRDSGRVKVPGEGATAEEIAAYRKAVGVPEAPTGYEFKPPVGEDGQPLELNSATLDRIATFAHKHGLPKGPMEALVSDYIQGELDDRNTRTRALDSEAQAWVKAQGAEANAKIAAIDKAATALGLTKEDLQGLRMAWGPEKALTVMAKLGAGMAEDTLIGGGTGKFGVTGEQAQAEIDRLLGDADFMKKVSDPNSAEHARWKRLNDAVGDAADRKARAA
ncbi:MAG: hypothetical protein B7Y36_08250 [Novosphingobium sp. 28-62-57]|uniref:hypothetical protein n=1 Tax=unclassified Novosphingobium TaxID=2644732 RepID=UPI000BC68391|nr:MULTISPECIES: hypothetical protein [unclassified Novosphingobium]OYW47916.1 MAG: hypothetical protein B7Z36_01345 [Novosphingobium sp. 12-63-9]OYZ10807.1 MAG: hypothetical protein B7Y36_08250 [Novosphingobium sp. 28-62-57]OZA36947.1 MAG: hypothetical protein B7X92_05385 [Novosphingobium sp. 17-62-9]HQS69738.1 hypothetical protein [Novosphingobium sp.]